MKHGNQGFPYSEDLRSAKRCEKHGRTLGHYSPSGVSFVACPDCLAEHAPTLVAVLKAAESVVRQGGHLNESWLAEAQVALKAVGVED